MSPRLFSTRSEFTTYVINAIVGVRKIATVSWSTSTSKPASFEAPRPRKPDPKNRFHISGQAAVRIAGRDFYLGPHDSPESYARYFALLAEYNANGRSLPTSVPTHQIDESIKVAHVIADYRSRELSRIEHNVGDHGWQSNLLNLIETKFGDIDTDDFGPRKLQDVRDVDSCRAILETPTGGRHYYWSIPAKAQFAMKRLDPKLYPAIDTLTPRIKPSCLVIGAESTHPTADGRYQWKTQ